MCRHTTSQTQHLKATTTNERRQSASTRSPGRLLKIKGADDGADPPCSRSEEQTGSAAQLRVSASGQTSGRAMLPRPGCALRLGDRTRGSACDRVWAVSSPFSHRRGGGLVLVIDAVQRLPAPMHLCLTFPRCAARRCNMPDQRSAPRAKASTPRAWVETQACTMQGMRAAGGWDWVLVGVKRWPGCSEHAFVWCWPATA
eukprot:359193-Chlamydomonas_euryale.AAC.5